MSLGVVTLGQVAEHLPILEVSCNRCERGGRLTTSRLAMALGANMPIPELRQIIAGDCPRMVAGRMHDVCGLHFPGLSGLSR